MKTDERIAEIVKRAAEIAKANGLSTEGFTAAVRASDESWSVSFVRKDDGGVASGGSGFVVRIDKNGQNPAQILRFQ